MKDLLAEFIGTFTLVFAITTTIVGTLSLTGAFGVLNLLAIALTAGLVLAVLIYTFGPLSGAHFNPAVTVALWVAGKFETGRVAPYLVAQFLGGVLASALLFGVVGGGDLGTTQAGAFGVTGALVMEVVATALFLIVILSVTRKELGAGAHAPLAIGFYLLVAHLYAIPFSGASLNPARSLGPALLSGGTGLEQVWLYFVSPIVGGVIGALVFRYVLEK